MFVLVLEEMETYVKLRRSLASKCKGKKSSSSIKFPSAPGPSALNVDFDDCILAHFAVFSQDVDNRIASMSSSIMTYASYWPVSAPASLSAPTSTPFGFRVMQVDRCLMVRAMPTLLMMVSLVRV